jgi:hypothetical protein
MSVRIEPREGLWLVSEAGVPLFAGAYGQVEDWLDLAENTGRLSSVPQPVSEMPPSRRPGLPRLARTAGDPGALGRR